MQNKTKLASAIILLAILIASIATYTYFTGNNTQNSDPSGNTENQVDEEICESDSAVPSAPFASFYVTPTIVVVNQPVTFLDASTHGSNTISNWSWNFGDGATAINVNPNYVYSSTGEKTVTLKITTTDGQTSTATKTIVVQESANYQLSFAEFSVSTTSPFVTQTITFTDTSSGDIGQWLWDMGDGTTSNDQNPVHAYSTAGEKTITLTVTDTAFRSGSVTHTLLVKEPIGPIASFISTPKEPTVDQIVIFNCTTTVGSGTVNKFFWNFGDGTTSTNHHPTHIYTTAGDKTVTLTVTDIYGKTSTVAQTIKVL